MKFGTKINASMMRKINIDRMDTLECDDESVLMEGYEKCPKCGAETDMDDFIIHCSECDWVIE